MTSLIPAIILLPLLAAFVYWLFITTEGTFLGRRVVVWLYDITADKYDGIKEYDDESEQFFVIRPLMHHLRHERAPLVLDVATGTGRVPHYLLAEATFNGRVIGLDPSRKMLAHAIPKTKPYHQRAGLVQGTAVPLPFPDDTFHAITCLESLEFFPDSEAALREMVRTLKSGGVLMVSRRLGNEGKMFLSKYQSAESIIALLQGMGLVEVNTQPWQIDYEQVFGEKPTP